MGRIEGVREDEMTGEQRRVAAEIAGPRSGLARGPFPVWLKTPELSRRVNDLAVYFKDERNLPARLRELAILVNAHHWGSEYQWHVHRRHALNQGYPQAALDAIAAGESPELTEADARAVFGFARAMYEPGGIPDDVYQAALETIGEQGVIELVSLLGFYSLIAVSIKGFDVGLPDGTAPYLSTKT